MKNFLKQNWSKILLAIIICGSILAGSYYWYHSKKIMAEKQHIEDNYLIQAKDTAAADNTIISGTIRDNFVQGLGGSCIQKQMGDQRTVSTVSAKVISDYCSCYANGIADQMTLGEIKLYDSAPAEQLKRVIEPKVDSVSPSCQKILQRE